MVYQNPVRKIRNNGFLALVVVATLYTLANIAYFAAGSLDQTDSQNHIS